MDVSHFIAKRIAFSKSKSFTRIIIRIAIAAIAVSLAVMILTTAIITGFKKEIKDKIFGFWGHIHITDSNINRNFELVPIDQSLVCFGEIRSIKQLEFTTNPQVFGFDIAGQEIDRATFGGVKSVYPYILMPGLATTKDLLHGVLLKGVGTDYDWSKMESFIIEGQPLKITNDSLSTDLLISKNIANKLFLKVGDKLILSFIREGEEWKKRFSVCGIYNTGLEEYDKRLGLVDIGVLQEVLGWQKHEVQGMEVVLDDIRDLDIMADYMYYEVVPGNLYVESIRAKFPSIFEWLALQDINEKVILQLMLLVAIINMITVLLILILERTQMIGILKSLGATHWQIRKIFVINAGYIIFFGLIFGNILGLSLAFIQKRFQFIRLDEANYYLSTAPISIDFWTVFWLNVTTFGITLVFLIIPTMLVSRITPVKALRFE